jgi:hypothetical protein
MRFRSLPSPDRWHGLLAVVGVLLMDVWFVAIIMHRQVDGLSFVLATLVLISLPIAAYIGYRTFGALTMEYWVERDAITLTFGSVRQIVPMNEILRIRRGTATILDMGPRPWHWPCPMVRRFFGEGVGVVQSFATVPLEGQLILETAGDAYGLSPAEPYEFLEAVQARFALGVAIPRSIEVRRPPLWRWDLWRDWRALVLIGAGFLGAFVIFGMLSFRFPALPSDVPLHFDVNGLPDRIAPKSGLFALPLIGLLAWVFNLAGGVWIYRRMQRQGAYLLWAGAVIVQIIAGLALLNAIRW